MKTDVENNTPYELDDEEKPIKGTDPVVKQWLTEQGVEFEDDDLIV